METLDLQAMKSSIQHTAAGAAQKAQSALQDASQRAVDVIHELSQREVIHVEGNALTLVKQLAEGGYGFVYLARHQQTGKRFAVKRMLAQDRETARLAAAVLGQLVGRDSAWTKHALRQTRSRAPKLALTPSELRAPKF